MQAEIVKLQIIYYNKTHLTAIFFYGCHNLFEKCKERIKIVKNVTKLFNF